MLAARYQNATDVRINFSKTLDNAVYSKPQFIRRTHNHVIMLGSEMLAALLSEANIHLSFVKEEDGSIVVTCEEIEDLIASGDTKEEALNDFVNGLIEYAEEYYNEYELYSRAPNRKQHLPIVLRVLAADSAEDVKEMLVCQAGKN